MVFNISNAASESSINQLKQSILERWNGVIILLEIYNIWYDKSTINNDNVKTFVHANYNNGPNTSVFYYNTTSGLYIYGEEARPASETNSFLSASELELLELYYPYIPISFICFPAGTSITTDQGTISIDKINKELHTINNKPIVEITKTIYDVDSYLVCFEKDCFSKNIPSERTIMTQNHKIFYNGKMVDANDFIDKNTNVKKIKYNGEILYNVLMKDHEKMIVNNLICETLNPKHSIAWLYKQLSKMDKKEQIELIKLYNDQFRKKNNILVK